MGVIRGEGFEVRKARPTAKVLEPVEHFVGAGKFAYIAHVVADSNAYDFVERRDIIFIFYAEHLDVLEAVVNECGVPLFGLVALLRVFIRLEFAGFNEAAERLEIKLHAVFGEHVGIAESHLIACSALDNEFAIARYVLTDIVYPAVFALPFANGGEFFVNANGLHFLRAHNAAGRFAELRFVPAVVVVAGLCPLAELEAGIVKFAVAYTRHFDGTVCKAFPRSVGNDSFRFVVRISNFKFAYHFGEVAPRCGIVVPVIFRKMIVEAVTESNTYNVFTLAEKVCNVVLHIKRFFVVSRESGGENIVARFFAVYIAFKITEAANREERSFNVLVKLEAFAEIVCADGSFVCAPCGYPFRREAFGKLTRNESAAEAVRLFAVYVFDLNGPLVSCNGQKVAPLVRNKHGFVRFLPAAIPNVGNELLENFACGIYADAAFFLYVAVHVRAYLIRKSGQSVYAAGIFKIIHRKVVNFKTHFELSFDFSDLDRYTYPILDYIILFAILQVFISFFCNIL